MEKKCSIRLLLLGIIVSAAFSLSAGFFAGTQKNWRSYEERIVLLQQQNADLLARQEAAESERKLAESLKVIPIMFKRTRLKTGIPVIVVMIALGKGLGTFYQLFICGGI